jgi:hypothetical protein
MRPDPSKCPATATATPTTRSRPAAAATGAVPELDGRASHAERRLQDNCRDNATAAHGLITLRYGWADVTERACETAFEVAETLRGRGWRGPLRACRRCRTQVS